MLRYSDTVVQPSNRRWISGPSSSQLSRWWHFLLSRRRWWAWSSGCWLQRLVRQLHRYLCSSTVVRFHSAVRPGSHEHLEHRRQDAHRPLLQLCSGIFGHGHGVNGCPRLRMKQGVKLHQRDLSGGFPTSAICWTRESSELSSRHIPHPRTVRINPPS